MYPLNNICPGTKTLWNKWLFFFKCRKVWGGWTLSPSCLMLLLLLWASALIKLYTLVRNWSLESCCTAGNSSQGGSCCAATQGRGRLAAPLTENCLLLSSRAWGFAGELRLLHPLDVTRDCTNKVFQAESFCFRILSLGSEQGEERAKTGGKHPCQSCSWVWRCSTKPVQLMKLDILIVLFAALNLVKKNTVQWLWLKVWNVPCILRHVLEWEHPQSARFEVDASKKGAEETSELVKAKLKRFSSSRLSPEELLC